MSGPTRHGALRRYWFPFDRGPLGIGVTAATQAEANEMAEAARAAYYPAFALREPVRDVDVSTLDAGHVLPNIGPPVVRGVWFPALNL